MKRKLLAGITVASLALLAGGRLTAANPSAKAPRFEVDPSWPQLPNNWVLGEVGSVAVGSVGGVLVVTRRGYASTVTGSGVVAVCSSAYQRGR